MNDTRTRRRPVDEELLRCSNPASRDEMRIPESGPKVKPNNRLSASHASKAEKTANTCYLATALDNADGHVPAPTLEREKTTAGLFALAAGDPGTPRRGGYSSPLRPRSSCFRQRRCGDAPPHANYQNPFSRWSKWCCVTHRWCPLDKAFCRSSNVLATKKDFSKASSPKSFVSEVPLGNRGFHDENNGLFVRDDRHAPLDVCVLAYRRRR
jgi:hypothetical protein